MARFAADLAAYEGDACRRRAGRRIDSVCDWNTPLRAQTLPPSPAYTYDVASIHRSAPMPDFGWSWDTAAHGGLKTTNTTVLDLLKLAYQVQTYQIIGAPGWASSEHYDITLTPAAPDIAELNTFNATEAARRERNWQRLQAVLHDRFGLVLRAETHELPVYALVQGRNGAKISRADGQPSSFIGNGPGRITATAQRMARLATFLSGELGRPVNDETGLDGQYDFKLEWTPDPAPSDKSNNAPLGRSIFTALADQLGLRLESKKGPVQVYVIEKIEHPSEN
jgi:bla regulator protein blaR1